MYYSQGAPQILDEIERKEKSKQLLQILKLHVGDLSSLKCLDVGCSSGVITNELSRFFQSIYGIDIDSDAIKLARSEYNKKNLIFSDSKGDKIDFPDNYFDVVIFNQVYEFTNNPQKLVKEIERVLKRNGVCLVGARNKYSFLEGQTGIPLIHFLPTSVSKLIAKLFSKNYYPANYLTLGEIKNLFKAYQIENITSDIICNPQKYSFNKLKKYSTFVNLLPRRFANFLAYFSPNYFLLCRKTI